MCGLVCGLHIMLSSHLSICTRFHMFQPLLVQNSCIFAYFFAVYQMSYVQAASGSDGIMRSIASSTVTVIRDRLLLTPGTAMQRSFLSSTVINLVSYWLIWFPSTVLILKLLCDFIRPSDDPRLSTDIYALSLF